jgi:hypothetical protein
MGRFLDRLNEFFAEDESWKQKDPIEFEGRSYGAWVPEEDDRKAWPNATCVKCGGIMLKKEMYWNRETGAWYHPDCLKELAAPKP